MYILPILCINCLVGLAIGVAYDDADHEASDLNPGKCY